MKACVKTEYEKVSVEITGRRKKWLSHTIQKTEDDFEMITQKWNLNDEKEKTNLDRVFKKRQTSTEIMKGTEAELRIECHGVCVCVCLCARACSCVRT